MEEEYNPSEPFLGVDENDVDTASGTENDSQPSFKDVLKEATGRDYPDDETALKSVTETYKYVGSLGQKVKTLEEQIESQAPIEAPASTETPELVQQVETLTRELAETRFYNENPQYNNEVAKELITAMGGSPAVVESDAFQKAYSAIQATAEVEKSKSVLVSNPRLGQATDKISQARESLAEGNQEAAANAAVAAVLSAYEIE